MKDASDIRSEEGEVVVGKSNSKFLEKTLQWKSAMEKMQTASDLVNFVQKSCFSNIEDDKKITEERQIVTFWILLGEKLTFRDQSLPTKVLQLCTIEPPPPKYVLRRLLEMTDDPREISSLSLRYTALLHLKSSTNDELPLHNISRRGCQFKNEFESILSKGIQDHVDGVGGCGGLVTRNRLGQTPLFLLFANVVSNDSRKDGHEDWDWMCYIIKFAVETNMTFSNKNDADSPISSIPLLHAALELGSPIGLINRVLIDCDDLTRSDSLGRTPLLIAVAQKNSTSSDVIMNLIRRCPAVTRQKDRRGCLPLHLKIKAGNGFHRRGKTVRQTEDENFNVLGTIVQEAPEALEVQDPDTKLLPFMLAAVKDEWSLDVVYGLLRTSPWVISSCSSHD